MIGNDIVDLEQAAAESNWSRPGYLDKIFSSQEQFLISSHTTPSEMVWLLWSMKESAYKIMSRMEKIREFAPLKLSCNNLIILDNAAKGTVLYEDQLYYTSSVLENDYIHTIAALTREELKRIQIKIMQDTGQDYKLTHPGSVSHHGKYLALVYL